MSRIEETGREYTHPDVLTAGVAEGWAEAETDPTQIDWPARQARAAIPFEVVGGRPVNPCAKTGITRGRNEMGLWGEQQMADALVTVTLLGTRYLLMIERGDGYGWAVPGGHVESGETGLQAAVRELAEETGLDARGWPFTVFREMPPRYVPDPRSSDEAWAVTIPVHIDLGDRDAGPAVNGGDDARRAEWIPAETYDQLRRDLARHFGGRVFAAHVQMLTELLGGNGGLPEVWSDAVPPGGYVCGVPDGSRPDGICGMPVESEPCSEHAEPDDEPQWPDGDPSQEGHPMTDALDFHPENIPVDEFPFPVGTTVRANGGGFYTVVDRDGSAFVACCTSHERAGTASGWYPQRDKGQTLGKFTDDGGWPELEDCGRDAELIPLTPDDVGTALDCGCVVELGNLPCEYHASKYGVARPDCGDCQFGVPLVYHGSSVACEAQGEQ